MIFLRFRNVPRLAVLLLACIGSAAALAQTQELPHLERRDGRSALIVDGKPFLMLGAQINNSSAWPATLPAAWTALEDFHVNTAEAPVYWEQMEPVRGTFDFSLVDLLVTQAREHHLHLVLLWFGTWKNGQNHYVPEWMKSDLKTYPREISAYGKVLDVMSPVSAANLDADKHAFAALLHHLREIDGTQHTVLMIQVENESGSIGSVRDFSPAAQALFAQRVPESLTTALHKPAGTWSQVFGAEAEERFGAYTIAHYINEVARAGKAEYPLLMYCNVWITYPVQALENRDRPIAGQEYPAGGPQQANIPVWKAAAPNIDLLAPDFYSGDAGLFRTIIDTYARPDNPLLIPESQLSQNFGRFLFYALGKGAIGFAPFGIDPQLTATPAAAPNSFSRDLADNFALLGPIEQQIATLNRDGQLRTAVEEKGAERQTLHFGDVEAAVSFGFPQQDGAYPPGTPTQQGRVLVAQLGPLDFLVTGFDASVSFQLAATAASGSETHLLEILRAEEGAFAEGNWQAARILNGDQTDRGLNFPAHNQKVIRIRLQRIPLNDPAVR